MSSISFSGRSIAGFSLLLGLAILLYFLVWREKRPELNGQAIVREVQQIHELGTVKYSVQKVVGLREQKIPFGAESILLVVQGRVIAGIDLAALKPTDVFIEKNKPVLVNLPPARIQQVYLDEKQTKVWDRNITWFTPWVSPNPDLDRQARLEALQSVEQTAREMGILADATKNARVTLRNLLKAFGISDVIFEPVS